MIEVMLFVKDFELGSKLSSACVDLDRQIEFTDENSDRILLVTLQKW